MDGRWRVQPGDLVVHPRFHVHENRFSQDGGIVANLPIPCKLATNYGVFRIADPELLISGKNGIADALHGAQARPPQIPPSWLRTFMEELLAPDAQVGAAARAVERSREHAARRFRDWFGTTPVGFIRENRLRRALAALHSGQPLAQVAAHAGYADQPHFTRSLRKALAITPGRLRGDVGH